MLPHWSDQSGKSDGINTVRVINLDNNRIQLRDGVTGPAFEFDSQEQAHLSLKQIRLLVLLITIMLLLVLVIQH